MVHRPALGHLCVQDLRRVGGVPSPLDPNRPLICFDEIGKELQATPRGQLPLAAGQGIRQDYEYERRGVPGRGAGYGLRGSCF